MGGQRQEETEVRCAGQDVVAAITAWNVDKAGIRGLSAARFQNTRLAKSVCPHDVVLSIPPHLNDEGPSSPHLHLAHIEAELHACIHEVFSTGRVDVITDLSVFRSQASISLARLSLKLKGHPMLYPKGHAKMLNC